MCTGCIGLCLSRAYRADRGAGQADALLGGAQGWVAVQALDRHGTALRRYGVRLEALAERGQE